MNSGENFFLLLLRPAYIVGTLSLLLGACGGGAANVSWTTGFQNGTYLAVAEHTQENGVAPYLRLTVEDERLADAKFGAVDEGGAITHHFEEKICAKQLMENQAPPVATGEMFTDWCAALANSLAQRGRGGDERPVLVAFGGVYTAVSEMDEEGWYARIEITFERQTLRNVIYEEYRVLKSGEKIPKRDDPDLLEAWQSEAGVELKSVYKRLGEQLRHEGLPSGVDIISRATATSQRFRNLARDALNKRQPVDFLPLQ